MKIRTYPSRWLGLALAALLPACDLPAGISTGGSIALALTWPGNLTSRVTGVTGTLDGGPVQVAVDLDACSLSYEDADAATGSHSLTFSFNRGSDTIGYTRAFSVAAGVRYSATIALGKRFFGEGPARIIDHTNYDPTGQDDDAITEAASLKVYFEHASVGQDIVGDSDAESSTGTDNDGSGDCGFRSLFLQDDRFLCDRMSYFYNDEGSGGESTDPGWFTTHSGLLSLRRQNPAPSVKVDNFVARLDGDMTSAVDVAMLKFCYIDVDEYSTKVPVTNGLAFANALIGDIEALESAHTGLVIPYWTMPLQTDRSFAARDAFNARIRAYCESNGRWLLDIADIQSHLTTDATEAPRLVTGYEAMYPAYATDDGGHLSDAGKLKLAKAYWSLLAAIAAAD